VLKNKFNFTSAVIRSIDLLVYFALHRTVWGESPASLMDKASARSDGQT